MVSETSRCEQIVQRYRNEPHQEVKDYCASQAERSNRLRDALERLLRRLLSQGSFIFRGGHMAVESLDRDLVEATRKYLAGVAAQVFNRYKEAPIRAETTLAEKFLRPGNLKAINSTLDPLGLVHVSGGTPQIKSSHKALVSIRDYIDRNGTVDGRRLSDVFTDAPFGWSPDTLRYLIAAMLVGGEIKLKVSGREVTVNGQQAIDALRTNQSFKNVGVALRDERPSNDVLSRAAERLTEVVGETIIPLEDDISKAATKHFPQLQLRYGPLDAQLEALGLPGAEEVRSLKQELADVLLTDGSDVPQRLGGEQSAFYERLHRAAEVDVALKNGLQATVRELQQHRQGIEALPDIGVPGQLRADLADELDTLSQRLCNDGFAGHAADLRSTLTAIKVRVSEAARQLASTQLETIREAQHELPRLTGWPELTQEEQAVILAELDALTIDAPSDLGGLRQLLNQQFMVQQQARDLRRRIEHLAVERVRDREEGERLRREAAEQEAKKTPRIAEIPTRFVRTLKLPARIREASRLEELITEFQQIRKDMPVNTAEIDVTIELEG
jgi:hypothetical protein